MSEIKFITPAEAAVQFRDIPLPDMRQFHPNLMPARCYHIHKNCEIAEIGIYAWLDAIKFDEWFNSLPLEARVGFAVSWSPNEAISPSGISSGGSWCSGAAPHYYWQSLLLRAWLNVWDAAYYAAPRELYSHYAAMDMAIKKRCPWVVTEDLS